MNDTTRWRRLALLLLLPLGACAALAHAGVVAQAPAFDEPGLTLRLIDGTLLRVPSDAAGEPPSGFVSPSASNGGLMNSGAPGTRQRSRQGFDPKTPGAVASVRG